MKKQLSYLYLSVRDLVTPLKESMASLEGLEYLFHKYGWEIELDEEGFENLKPALVLKEPLEKFIDAVDLLMDKPQEEEIGFSDLEVLIDQGNALIKLIANLEVDSLSDFKVPLKDPEFWADIADHLFNDLLVTYIQIHKPIAHALLQFLGVIRYEEVNSLTPFRTAYTRVVVDWDQLVKSVTNPLQAFNAYYHWNQKNQDFDHRQFLRNLHRSLESLKVQSHVTVPSNDFLSNTAFNPSTTYNIEEEVMELYIPFLYGMYLTDRALVELGLSFTPIPKNGSGPPFGLLLRPISRGAIGQEVKLNENLKLDWKLVADTSNLLQIKFYPDSVHFESNEINAGAAFGFHSTFTGPHYIFGSKNTTHLRLEQFSIEFKILGTPSDPEIQLIFRIYGNPGLNATIVIDESDNFLQETVAKKPIEAGFSPEIIWSNKSGITFNGSVSLDTVIGLNKEVAGITFESLYFSLSAGKNADSPKSTSMNLALAVSGNLGPVNFRVEKIGFSLEVNPFTRQQLQEQAFDKPSLVFGNLGLDLDFLPPKGIGILVKSDILTGGGFLELDPGSHRYSGVLALKLALEKRDIGLVAVGMIETRLPNAEKGFSMLISISVYFSPAIPLAFGFNLYAVGGLVGIHRTMNVDILRERIRNG
ncbi:MAG TPA: DUF6603 domain-containing protein, partial [Lunatimonas sp.]|nr:DUF6603 domain-containing protein [Lunatimonas sp.]